MGRDDYSQSSQLSTLVGKPVSRYTQLPKNTNTLRKLTEAKTKPNNRYHYSIYPSVETEYQASYSQLTNLDFYSPIITILGNNPYAHLINTPFTDPGVTLDDGSTLVSNVSTVNTNAFGTFKITYVATDGINPDTTSVRIVKVGEFPDATIDGDNPYTLERYDPYYDEGMTINDANSTVRSTTSTVNNTAVGNYTVNYTVANEVFARVYSRAVKVVDTSPPVVTILGDNPYTLERFDVYTDPGATGDRGTTVTTDLSNVQNTSISSFVVVYNATDGNTLHDVAVTRTVNVVDTVPPVITIVGDNPYTLERFDVYTDSGATVDRGSILTTDLTAVNNALTHGSSFVVTYTSTDGNTAHDVTQTRTVNIVDTKPPVITLLGDDPYEIQPGVDFRDVDPLYEVDLGTSVSIDYSNVVTTDNSVFYVVYRASDGVNPDAVVLRRVSVADTLSPIVTIIGDNPYTLERYAEYVDPGATTDTQSGSRFVSTVSTVNNTVVGSYTVTYDATDDINANTIVQRIVNVVDTTAPIVTLNGASSVTLERYGVFADIDEGVEIEAPGSLVSVDISQLDNTTQGTYTVTYNVVDDQNNANVITREVVVQDTVPPVVTLNDASTFYTLERYGVWADIDPGVTVDEGSYLYSVSVDNTAIGNQSVEYIVKDGTNQTDVFRTIRVYEIITITGGTSVTTERFGQYNDLGATTSEAGFYITTDLSNVDTSISHGSSFDVVYTATNGDITRTAIRTVNVQDTTPPVITIVGTPLITLERYEPIPDLSTTVNLDEGSYLTSINTDAVDNTVVGSYSITYNASDGVNTSQLNRTVRIADTTPPLITLNGDNPYYVERFSNFVDPFAYADAGSTMLPADLSNVDTSLPYGDSFDVVYSAVDISSSNTAIRTVIIDDTQPIVASLIGPNPNVHERSTTYIDAGITVDNSASYTLDTTNVNVSDIGSFDIVYDVTDGNVAHDISVIRTVNVVDTTPPIITLNNGSIITTQRFGTYVDPGVTLDIGSTLISTDLSNVDTTLPHNSVFDVVYHCTDDGGNSNTAIRTVIVKDTTPPIPTLLGDDPFTLERFSNWSDYDPGLELDPGSRVESVTGIDTTTVGTYTATYNLTDDVNSNTITRTVIVIDTTPPVGYLVSNIDVIEQGTSYVDPGVYNLDAGSYLANTDLSNVDTTLSHESQFDVIYDLGDGNVYQNTLLTRTVTVVDYQVWTQDAKVFQSPVASEAEFGNSDISVSSDGTYMIAGAPFYTSDRQGAASVFVRSNGSWSQQQLLTAPTRNDGEYFGGAVSIASSTKDYIAISAYRKWDTSLSSARGMVFIYNRSGSSWSLQTSLSINFTYYFGLSVSLNGNGTSLIVGESYSSSRHHAYIYNRSGSSWNLHTTLNEGYSGFGYSVSMSADGTYACVGSGDNGFHVYTLSNNTWSEQAHITRPSNLPANSYFGRVVKMSSDKTHIIVTAYTYGAYIYVRNGTDWSLQDIIGSNVGFNIAISDGGKFALIPDGSNNVDSYARTGNTWYYQNTFGIGQSGSIGISGNGQYAFNGYSKDAQSGSSGFWHGSMTIYYSPLPT